MKTDWDAAFKNAPCYVEGTRISLTISNRKPLPGRNLFQEDKEEIMKAAAKHGFKMLTDLAINPRAVTFVKY